MNNIAKKIQRVYLGLTLLSTLAASFIWGINTLFLLDAGLSNTEAFAANAFFTVGQVVFEVPTGVVADTYGRRMSYLLGAGTLLVSTLLYLLMWQIQAPFWAWAVSSASIGLGFTFFSGAVEAWLVDSLKYAKYKGPLESMFAKAQVTGGIAMLLGSVAGGFIAQATNLGVPYILRSAILGITLVTAWLLMKDLGFVPEKHETVGKQMRKIFKASIDNGFRKPAVRWVMLAAPFSTGVGIYAFYAMQPYLLELYGDPSAYSVAGLAAAVIAGAQIAGGVLVPQIRKLFSRRTNAMILGAIASAISLAIIGWTSSFVAAVGLLIVWAMVFAAVGPLRQAYLNGMIPSKQRATVLSFDSLMGSSGAVATQPVLGRVADVYSYSASYLVSAIIQIGALPFVVLARGENAKSDPISKKKA
ncbi:MAG: MFS transporter [Candidatus Saccharimonadales bacterium]|nr:MFS transporter [Candidatus Saccharimonadales bacterium]